MSAPKKQRSNVVSLPPDWKSAFQSQAMKTSFCLALTQPMLEFLCAVADGVHWDRMLYSRQYGIARPNNWIASEGALVKRGLVERLSRGEMPNPQDPDYCLLSVCRLTPAGAALVELLKVTGIFIVADSALARASGVRS